MTDEKIRASEKLETNPQMNSSSEPTQNKVNADSAIENAIASSTFQWQSIFTFLAAILAIIAIITIIYIWNKLDNDFGKQLSQQTQNQQQQTQLMENLQQEITSLQRQIKDIELNIAENTAGIQKLATVKTADTQTYVLNEVKHLLLLAQLNLQFEQDASGSLALLESAQQRLSQRTDPLSLKLRQNIATSIIQLKSLPQINKSDLLIKLNALSLQIAQLPLTPTSFKIDKNAPTSSVPELTGWRKYWQQSLERLNKLIVIRYHEKPLFPLLTPEQRTNLIYIIQTKFSQASWAVIHDDQAVFTTSLEQIKQWIKQNYADETPAAQSILKEIASLQQTQLHQKKFDLTNNIKIVDELLKRL